MTERRLEKQVELDATPEQVWAAIATGEGASGWYVPQSIEPRVGGTITMRFGTGFDVTGRVTAYEPRPDGGRFAYGAGDDVPEGTPSYAFEFFVESRDGGGAVLKFVQSGFTDESWDAEYDGLNGGWDLFFANLRTYLAHFAGQPVHPVVSMGFMAGKPADAWPVLLAALGLDAVPAEGTAVTLTGPSPITGVVDCAGGNFLGVRTPHSLHRFGVEGDDGCGVSAYHYFFGEPVDVDALTAAWDGLLADLFPAPHPLPAG